MNVCVNFRFLRNLKKPLEAGAFHVGVRIDNAKMPVRPCYGHLIENVLDRQFCSNEERSYSVFEVGVAYTENVDSVIEFLQQIDESMRQDPDYKNDIIEPLEILGLDKFADSAIILKARTKLISCAAAKRLILLRLLRNRVISYAQ